MPQMSVDDAAREVLRGVSRNQAMIVFPPIVRWIWRLNRAFPSLIYWVSIRRMRSMGRGRQRRVITTKAGLVIKSWALRIR